MLKIKGIDNRKTRKKLRTPCKNILPNGKECGKMFYPTGRYCAKCPECLEVSRRLHSQRVKDARNKTKKISQMTLIKLK